AHGEDRNGGEGEERAVHASPVTEVARSGPISGERKKLERALTRGTTSRRALHRAEAADAGNVRVAAVGRRRALVPHARARAARGHGRAHQRAHGAVGLAEAVAALVARHAALAVGL